MLQQLLFYSIIIALNPTLILSNGAGISLSKKIQNADDFAVTEDNWRPIMNDHIWLPAPPTALTPTLPQSIARPFATTFRQNVTTRNQLTTHTPQYKYNNNNTYTSINSNNMRRHGGNNDKILTPATIYRNPQKTSSTSSDKSFEAIKNFQSKPDVYPFYININNSSTGSNKYISDTHHLQQAFTIKNNKRETEHPTLQKPKYVSSHIQDYKKSVPHAKNRSYSTPTQSNLNHLSNTAEAIEPANGIQNTFRAINFQVETNRKNQSDNILPTRLNDSINNENLNDNDMINDNSPHYQAPLSDSVHRKTDKSSKSLGNADTDVKAEDDNKEDIHCGTLLRETFEKAKRTYRIAKDNVFRGTHKTSDNRGTYNSFVTDDDYQDHTNEDNDRQNPNSSFHQVLNNTSMTPTAAIEAAVKKLDSYNMINMLLSLAATDKVKGRKRQIDKGHTKKYTLIKSTSPAAGLLSSYLQDINRTQNKAERALFQSTPSNGNTQARAHLQNLSTNFEIISSVVPSPYTLLKADTSKGLVAYSSARKIKKLKKKFEKFLLPLVMAYKLKFMVLIPVLIAGLILLVGSTGLAGFFFALFTAVMSLKNDPGNAIVVKRY